MSTVCVTYISSLNRNQSIVTVSVRVACMLLGAVLVLPARAAAQRTVYITHGGGNVTTFGITPAGDLIPLDVITGVGNTLRGIAIAPDGRKAYVVDSDLATVTAFSIDDSGRLTQIGQPVETHPNAPEPLPSFCGPGGTRPSPCPFGIAVAPNGRRVYVANSNTDTVSVFAVRHDGGLRLMGSPVPTRGIGPRGLALSPNGRHLYVPHRDTESISVFSIRQNGGLALQGEPVRLRGCTPLPENAPTPQCSPYWVSITPDGRWLYSTNQFSADLATFAVGTDGGLTEVGRVQVGGRPEGIAITTDTRFLLRCGH